MQQSQRDRETPTPPYRHPAFGPRKVRKVSVKPLKPKPVEPEPVPIAAVEVAPEPEPEPAWEPRIVRNAMRPIGDTEFWRPIAKRAASLLKEPTDAESFFGAVSAVVYSSQFSLALNAMAAAEALGYARHDARTGMWHRTGLVL